MTDKLLAEVLGDLRIDTYSDSSSEVQIRITHLPTNTITNTYVGASRHRTTAEAKMELIRVLDGVTWSKTCEDCDKSYEKTIYHNMTDMCQPCAHKRYGYDKVPTKEARLYQIKSMIESDKERQKALDEQQ